MKSFERAVLVFAFLFLVVPLAFRLAILIPPGWMADEPAHAMRADDITRGAMVGYRQNHASGIKSNPTMIWVTITPPNQPPFSPQLVAVRKAMDWYPQRKFLRIGQITSYAPIVYLPAALGFGIAHLVHLSPWYAYRLARLGSCTAFAILGALALLLAQRGLPVLFLTLAVPMTVGLAASINPDGVLTPIAVLAIALLTGGPLWRRRAGLALVAVVCLSKPAYLPLALLGFVPMPKFSDRDGWIRGFATMLLVALPALLWFGYTAAFVMTGGPPGTNPGAQFHAMAVHPLAVWAEIFGGILQPYLLHEMIGLLGWLDLPLPGWAYTVWMTAGAGALLTVLLPEKTAPAWLDSAFMPLVAASSVILIATWLYFTWTHAGSATLEGLQGRYFLPLVPVLALSGIRMRGLGPNVNAALRGAVAIGLAATAAVMLACLPLSFATILFG